VVADEANNGERADAAAGPSSQANRWPLLWTAVTAALRDVLEPLLAAALRHRLPAEPGVHLVDVSLTSHAGFHRNVQEPTCCYALAARSARAADEEAGQSAGEAVWVDVATEIAYPIIDLLLGGSGGRAAVMDRPLTAVERRLLRRLPEAVAECFSTAAEGEGVSVALSDSPAHAAPPQPAGRPEAVLLTFRLTCRGADGAVRVCMPISLLEAVLARATADLGPGAAVELSAAWPESSLPASELAALRVGDILATDAPLDDEVTVRLAGVAKFAARLGACRGKRAITITRPLPPAKPQ
jgi:flagellar motor switch protein FliM